MILFLFRELWTHFEVANSLITQLNRIVRQASLEDENFVEFVKIKMRVLFCQYLSYKVTILILYLFDCFYLFFFMGMTVDAKDRYSCMKNTDHL